MEPDDDVVVIDRGLLDDEYQKLHPKPWLMQYEDGSLEYFDDEEQACAAQRSYRTSRGLDEMTGLPSRPSD